MARRGHFNRGRQNHFELFTTKRKIKLATIDLLNIPVGNNGVILKRIFPHVIPLRAIVPAPSLLKKQCIVLIHYCTNYIFQ